MDAGAVLRVGWLSKRGAGWNPKAQQLGRWLRGRQEKQRYFVLVCHMLYYFVDGTCKQEEEKGRIDVRAVTRLLIEEDMCVFELVTAHRVYVLRAETASDADGWLRAICAVAALGGEALPIESALGVLYSDQPAGDASPKNSDRASKVLSMRAVVRSRRGWLSKTSSRTTAGGVVEDEADEEQRATLLEQASRRDIVGAATAAMELDRAADVQASTATGRKARLARRFFILRARDFELLYFRKERGAGQSLSNPLGRIDLRTVRQIHDYWKSSRRGSRRASALSAPPTDTDGVHFEIELADKTYHLAAANVEEKASWLADLRSVVEIASQTYDSDSNGDMGSDYEGEAASSSAGSASASASAAGAEKTTASAVPAAGGRSVVGRRGTVQERDRAVLVESLRLSSLSLALNAALDSGTGDVSLEGWLFKRARRKGASSMDSDAADDGVLGGGGAGGASLSGEQSPSGRGGESGGANSALRLAAAQVRSGQLPAKWKTANIHEMSSFQFKKRYFTLRPPMLHYDKVYIPGGPSGSVSSGASSVNGVRSSPKVLDLSTVCGILRPHDAPECFQLLADERTITLSASGPAEASVWVAALREHIGTKDMPRRIQQMKGWCAYDVSMADLVSLSSLAEVEEGAMGSSEEEEEEEENGVPPRGGGARRKSMAEEWKTSQLIMEGRLRGDGQPPAGDTPLTDVTVALGFPDAPASADREAEAAGKDASAVPVLSASPADVSSPAPAARPAAPAPGTPGADATGSAMHHGWLFKKGAPGKGLFSTKEKSRYFVLALHTGILRYFKAPPKGALFDLIAVEEARVSSVAAVRGEIGVIDLRAVTTCAAQPGGGFTLSTPSRTYQLRAETEALARGWTEACQAVIARRGAAS